MNAARTPARGASRFAAHLPGLIHDGDREYGCEVHDLSRKGARLAGAFPTPTSPELDVTVTTVAGDLKLRLSGRVMRVWNDPEGGMQVGIEFGRADDAGREVLEALLARVIEGMTLSVIEQLPDNPSAKEVHAALDKIPLAQRITLATRGNVKEREILMKDPNPNPQMLDALARNPNLLPPEVRTLLRQRGLMPATLATLARDGRWVGQKDVMLMIISHPNTPVPVGERLSESLSPFDLRKLLTQPGMNPVLRMKLGKRRGR